MADDEMHVGALGRVDHRGAVVQRQRHRLFDQQMLAVPCRQHGMSRMMLMRGRHIDDLDIGIGAEFLDGFVRFGRENCLAELRPRVGARIRHRDQR